MPSAPRPQLAVSPVADSAALKRVERMLAQRPDSVVNRYIVTLRKVPRALDATADLVGRFGGHAIHVYEKALQGFAVANLPTPAIEALRRHPLVASVEPDQQLSLIGAGSQALPADNSLYHLDRIDQTNGWITNGFYSLDRQYIYPANGTGVHIYIVDTGVRGSHSEFAGRIGNGVSKIAWSLGANPYIDAQGHGTRVASMAAGATRGVAKGATIHSVRIDDGEPNPHESDVIAGIDWVAANHIYPAVLNLSTTGSQAVGRALLQAASYGVRVVKGAGNGANDNGPGWDACLDGANNTVRYSGGVTVVGGINQVDEHYSSGNFGACIDIHAPATALATANHLGDNSFDPSNMNGTSLAAPQVAGAIALILESNRFAYAERVLRMQATPGKITSLPAGSPNLILNVRRGVAFIEGPDEVTSHPDYPTGHYFFARPVHGGTWTHRWELSIDGGPFQTVATGETYAMSVPANARYEMRVRLVSTSSTGDSSTDEQSYSVQPYICDEYGQCYYT